MVTLVIDKLTDVNYGFLLHKPEAFSILSFLSDSWPLYLLQLHAVALLFFLGLYAPFAIYDLVKRGQSTGGSGEPPLPGGRNGEVGMIDLNRPHRENGHN